MYNSEVPPEPPKVIENIYNPPKLGRAFYFETHFMQVHNVCHFLYMFRTSKKKIILMKSHSTYAQKFSRKSVKKEWHIYSCGFVQDMATAMDFT